MLPFTFDSASGPPALVAPAAPRPSKDAKGRVPRRRSPRRIAAAYDAAQTTDENRQHWAWADSLSANAAHDPTTRQTLRDRSRYECANNCYASGLTLRLAHDLIGTGPRLQVSGVDRAVARAVERRWREWAIARDLAGKLRCLHETRIRDGEAFALLHSNPSSGMPVQLDLQLYESEQVADPWRQAALDPLYVDGVRSDAHGNRLSYTLLKSHPGGVDSWHALETVEVPASAVIHWYRPSRPGQVRGVPELTPALPLFALLRRWTLATVTAAEVAAMLAGVMETDSTATYTDPSDDGAARVAFDRVALERGTLLSLPQGWKATQFKPEQPHQSYELFRDALLNEIGRCLDVPFNVIAGNSSRYNYSSGRLDHLGYHRGLWVERDREETLALVRLFAAWLAEAVLIPGYLPDGAADPALTSAWHWDGFESIDPLKDAQTDAAELAAGTTTYAEIYARKGEDWREQFEQRAAELAEAKRLGLPLLAAPAAPAPEPPEEAADAATAAA